jgi:hypothetical protein
VLEEGLGLEAEKILGLSFGWVQTSLFLPAFSMCFGKSVVKPDFATPVKFGLSSGRELGVCFAG